MIQPNFKFFFNNKSETLDVILHGGSQGMDSSLINKLVEKSKSLGNSVVAFNFLYIERGEENSSGPELIEELDALQFVMDYCRSGDFKHIRLIGKSLGGVVAASYLTKLTPENMSRFSAIILGYDIGYIDIKSFTGKIKIVQGSKDKFGDIEVVKSDIKGLASKEIAYVSIEGADHSYRVPETKDPIYEDDAVNAAFEI
ncbi:MAG: hypothetical protein NTY75_00300 [Candidatus Shapirobacteria bacterium]|nr:hypothetical protein [Candidatus Shapirobacteria bacterium]